jgi:leucyl/phenylalanyl-tRNA--protein transferase
MGQIIFPPVDQADEHGLLAVGGNLEPGTLLEAYRNGIFPWPLGKNYPLTWFSPPNRAVLLFENFRIPRTVRKEARRKIFTFRFDTCFEEVITACARSRNRAEKTTWITDDIMEGYLRLHRSGAAHSVECFLGKKLVGGLYGVSIGRMFAGESMFYRKDNASKLSFLLLVSHLQMQGCRWLDCQQSTPLVRSFGAAEIPRKEFLKLLRRAVREEEITFTRGPVDLPEL